MSNRPIPAQIAKAILLNYDAAAAASEEQSCFRLSDRTQGMLLSLTEYIGWPTRWNHPALGVGLTPDESVQVRAWANTAVRELLIPECENGGCTDYAPTADFIDYQPNNPYTTPLLIPPGYSMPPWYTNAGVSLPGVKPGDAMVNGLSLFGPAIPVSGFPRFRLKLPAARKCEIEFVQIPAGGVALVVVDSNPLSAVLVDLSTSIIDNISMAGLLSALGVPGSTGPVSSSLQRFDFDPGDHIVDVTFLPNLGGETLIGFGGGIRRVEVCHTNQEDTLFQLRQNEDNTCHLEQSLDGGKTWALAFDYSLCKPKAQSPTNTRYPADGGPLQESYDGGVTWIDAPEHDQRYSGPVAAPYTADGKCKAAASGVQFVKDFNDKLYPVINTGASVITIVGVIAGILAIIITGGIATPIAIELAAALVGLTGSTFLGLWTDSVYDQLLCILYCNANDDGSFSDAGYRRVLDEVQSQIGGLAGLCLAGYFQLMGPVGLTNAGHASKQVTPDCSSCGGCGWCFTWDFLTTVDDWHIWTHQGEYAGQAIGTWESGLGFRGKQFPNLPDTSLEIYRTWGAATPLTSIEVTYTADAVNGPPQGIYLRPGTGYDATVFHAQGMAGNSSDTVAAILLDGTARDSITVQLYAALTTNFRITRITLRGTGTNPFGTDNCP